MSCLGIPQKATGLPTTGILSPDKQVYGFAMEEWYYPLTSYFLHIGKMLGGIYSSARMSHCS